MGIKISNLPGIVAPALSDDFPVVQSGVTYKESCTQLQSLLTGSGEFVLTSFAGTQHIVLGSLQVDIGSIQSGLSRREFRLSLPVLPKEADSDGRLPVANPC